MLALIVLCSALAASAPAQNATGELEGKMDELRSNVDRQGSLQEQIDAQNAQINQLIAQESGKPNILKIMVLQKQV